MRKSVHLHYQLLHPYSDNKISPLLSHDILNFHLVKIVWETSKSFMWRVHKLQNYIITNPQANNNFW